MAESITLARPYAKATFALAQEQGKTAEWSSMLANLAALLGHADVRSLVGNPRVEPDQLIGLLSEAAGDLPDGGSNFLKLLEENGRLAELPEIAVQFEALRSDADNTVEAEMHSAVQPSDAQIENVRSGLAKRFGRDVNLNVVVDESLIGGALIRAGDLVIDGTVKSKLARLGTALARS